MTHGTRNVGRREAPPSPMGAVSTAQRAVPRTALGLAVAALSLGSTGCGLFRRPPPSAPNVLVVVAEDLGCAELGCYGQAVIRTPHLDALAQSGMRFAEAYGGSPAHAAAHCCLLTGQHTGHAAIRGARWRPDAGALPSGITTLGHVLRGIGHRTAVFGSWSLGEAGTTGHPRKQGFDRFFGALGPERGAAYPEFLWQDADHSPISGRHRFAPDVIAAAAVRFLEQHDARQRFFLFLPLPLPGAGLEVPVDSLVQYKGRFPESPAARPGVSPRAAHAARVTRLDEQIGELLAVLKRRKLEQNTIVVFTSDHGPRRGSTSDPEFFNATGRFRSGAADPRTPSLREGDLRVPLLVRWPGKVRAGAVSYHVCAAWDLLPTLAELTGTTAPALVDGLSFVPTLRDRPSQQRNHGYLYWEQAPDLQAIRMGRWKAIRRRPDAPVQLFDLDRDPGEQNELAQQQPQVVRQVEVILDAARTPSTAFPLRRTR
ncbi:MAG: sulfatase-like hydrolase/transferase [Planctomycetes bacterium]|nr:sulfatase-like hydrolase/transferase [Planctomycetota bacterium]